MGSGPLTASVLTWLFCLWLTFSLDCFANAWNSGCPKSDLSSFPAGSLSSCKVCLSVVLQLAQACSPAVLMTSFIPFSSLLKFLSHVCCASHASAWDPPDLSSPVNPWVTDSSFSLEKSHFLGISCSSPLVLISALSFAQLQNSACFSHLSQLKVRPSEVVGCVFCSPWCSACNRQLNSYFWIGVLSTQVTWGDGYLVPLAKSGFHSL